MSVDAITWALKTNVKHSSAKFVLVVLANCASGETMEAYPSIQHIADATEQDRKTVLANIQRLIVSGHISDTGKRAGVTKQVVIYRLNSTEINTVKESQKRDGTESGTVPFFPINSTVFPHKESQISVETVPKTGHGTVSEPSIEPSGKQNRGESLDGELFIGVSKQVVTDFKKLRSTLKAPITKTAIDGIQREADKAGVTLEAALTVCIERSWRGFKAEWMEREKPNARASPGYKSVHEQRAETIAGLTGRNRNERTTERDISGEARVVAG